MLLKNIKCNLTPADTLYYITDINVINDAADALLTQKQRTFYIYTAWPTCGKNRETNTERLVFIDLFSYKDQMLILLKITYKNIEAC